MQNRLDHRLKNVHGALWRWKTLQGGAFSFFSLQWTMSVYLYLFLNVFTCILFELWTPPPRLKGETCPLKIQVFCFNAIPYCLSLEKWKEMNEFR